MCAPDACVETNEPRLGSGRCGVRNASTARPSGAREARKARPENQPGIAPYGCGACQAALRCESAAIRTSAARSARPMTVNDERHGSIPIHLLYEDDLEQWRSAQDESTRNWSAANCFQGRARQAAADPGRRRAGRSAVVVGLGRRNPREELSCWAAAAIARSIARRRLPSGADAAGPPGDAVRVRLGVRAVQVRALSARESAASGPSASAAEARRCRSRATASGDHAGARSDQHARQRHVAGGTGAGGRRGRASLRRAASRDHRRRPAQGALSCGSRSRTRSGGCAATGRYRMGRSVASEGHARRQGRVLRHRRPRHQARRIDAADEEGHGRRRGRACAGAARSWMRSCRCACA